MTICTSLRLVLPALVAVLSLAVPVSARLPPAPMAAPVLVTITNDGVVTDGPSSAAAIADGLPGVRLFRSFF